MALAFGAILALSSCGGMEMNCSGKAQCAGHNNEHNEDGNSKPEQTPASSHPEGPPPSTPAPFKQLYSNRTLRIGLPVPSNCNSSVDFDEGRAWSEDKVSPDGSELDLRACYIEFGQYVNARSAGISDNPTPSPEACLEAARSGGLQTIEDWGEVYKAKPIKAGMTLCFETEEGNIARVEVTEANWKRYSRGGEVYHRPFYTFRATAWSPIE